MGKIILKTDIEPKEGHLYYCARVDGKLAIGEAPMARGSKKKKKKAK